MESTVRISICFRHGDHGSMNEHLADNGFTDLEVNALPPLDSKIDLIGNMYIVTDIILEVRGNKASFWTVVVSSLEAPSHPAPDHKPSMLW